MIEIRNVGEVSQTIDKWLEEVEGIATKFCRGVAVRIFEQTLMNSVQYSGDFAANWKFSLNSIDTSFKRDAVPEFRNQSEVVTWTHGKEGEKQPFFSRFMPMDDRGEGARFHAVSYTLRSNRGRDEAFKLGDTIYISNSAAHDEPYAEGIENGTIKLRIKSNARPLGRAVDAALMQAAGGASVVGGDNLVWSHGYKEITKRSQLDSLRRRPTGGLK